MIVAEGKRHYIAPQVRLWGTVTGSDGSTVKVSGLARLAGLGDMIEIDAGDHTLGGEVIAIDANELKVMLLSAPVGLRTGQKAWLRRHASARPRKSWLGQVLDAFGRPTSGEELAPDPADDSTFLIPYADQRRPLGARLATGLAALDTFLPLCRGQRLGVFAGSGVGKSRLMSDLALGVSADVVVIGLIGERTREVGDFVRLLRESGGLDRAVIIAATSDQSALVKRRAADLTMATAEYFRDHG
ncbi:MAG: flagellum-specific ATP synthase FliI, partial [Pseudomonadota bacterium]